MDKKSIVLALNRKGWRARVIHDNLVATFDREAIPYGITMTYLCETQVSPDDRPQ
jgi:hypothetical protein